MKKRIPITLIFIISIFLSMLVSCEWIDKDVEVPSYIYIPQFSFEALPTDGSSSHNITDAWVFVNGQKIGAFELPATIPVLASGESDIIILPGIMLNGTAATRAVYTFYTRYEAKHKLYRDSVISIQPSATYIDDLTFGFIEDFEFAGTIFEKSNRSDTFLMKTNNSQHVFEGNYSGHIVLERDREFAEFKTISSYNLSKTGDFSFVEIDCKSTCAFYIGINANESTFSTQHPIIVITPSDNWKKLYVNLTPTVSRLQSAIDFDIFIAAQLEEGMQNCEIWIDNIKLVYYD